MTIYPCIGIIYKISNTKNLKVYIGQTIQKFDQRKREHIRGGKSNKNIPLYSSMRKHGINNFIFEPIITCFSDTKEGLIDILNEIESKTILQYRSNDSKYGYNCDTGGLNYIRNERSRVKMSQSAKARGPNTLGHTCSIETKFKISQSQKKRLANHNPLRGRKHSIETKIKIGKANKDRVHNIISRKNMGKSHMKNYILTKNNGEVMYFTGLRQFLKDNPLYKKDGLRRLLKGIQPSYKDIVNLSIINSSICNLH